jgi:hypothetical protein
MNRWVSLWALVLSFVMLSWPCPSWAQERCPLVKSGSVNDQSLKQSGRLQGGGGASVCGAAKATPSVLTPQSSFPYAATTFRNRSRDSQCVTVSVTSTSGGGLQSTAYLGTFAPATPALNYLGDGGDNATLSTITYGITVPALADFVVVVSSVTANAAATYDLSVTGCGAVVVTSVAPNAGPTAGGTNVTIKGTGFLADATVTIGGAAATNVSVVDDATIGATTPAGTEGAADVVVTNALATSSTLAGGFVYVAGTSTTITLASSKNPTVFGEAVSFTATLASGAGTPTGSVAFYDGAAKIGDANLAVGVATLSTSTLAAGPHAITAKYSVVGAFLAATSAVVEQQVARAATTTALTSSKNPSGEGESITLSATVTAVQPGGGIPSGSVTFSDGGVAFVTVSLDGTGKASFTTSALAVGGRELVVSYAGTDTHAGSISAQLVQAVGLPSTATSLLTSKTPSLVGESVTFTAVVATSLLGGVPTGSVTFKDGDTAIATSPLDGGGRATFTTAALTEGLHVMTAVYGGAAGFSASASAPFAQNVRRDPGISGSSGTSSGAVDAGADSGTAPEGVFSAGGGGCSCREAPTTTSNASMLALAIAAVVMATRRAKRTRR